jgi:hypothetical protein
VVPTDWIRKTLPSLVYEDFASVRYPLTYIIKLAAEADGPAGMSKVSIIVGWR